MNFEETVNPEIYNLSITRILKAPRELVFEIWTDPKHLAQWWGPTGFTNPVCKVHLHPGGEIYIDMKGPDGTVYPMGGHYKEIVNPEKLVFVSSALDKKGSPIFEVHNTVHFFDQDGHTKLTIDVTVTNLKSGAKQYLDGMEMGWKQSLEKLTVYTDKQQLEAASTKDRDTGKELIIRRVLNAPRELVFKVWTDPEHIAKWWGPNGFTNTIEQMDIRPGGEWRLIMHGPDGTDYKNKNVFVEVGPSRIIYDHVSGPKFQAIVTFEEQGNKTKLTWRMVFESAEQLKKVIEEFGAAEGLKQNVEKLVAYLKYLN